MIFKETRLKGSYIIEPERIGDDRGFFARTWCKKEFETHGLNSALVQCNISFNKTKGTLRGMHYQESPYSEAKLIRCTSGSVYDVIIDLRKGSDTYKEWISVELSEENRKMLYIPEECAHGFITLTDGTEVFYQMSEFYKPDHAKGIRWNDPQFGIKWPVSVSVISDKDMNFPDYRE